MKISPTALQTVLAARGMPIETLVERTEIDVESITQALDSGKGLEDEEISLVADQLGVPVEALFSDRELPLFPSVDFRTASPHVQSVDKGTIDAIAFVERLSSTFASLGVNTEIDPSLEAAELELTDANAIKLAEKWRERWGVSIDQQLEWRDSNKLYVSLRAFIEGLGVLVLHRSFKTDQEAGLYINVEDGPHAIVINTTKSSKARKLFTLAHEFCHVLLRKEGVSNPSVVKNRVEKFCNKFAAYLLAPLAAIKRGLERYRYEPSEDSDFLRLFAANLGISQEALLVRLIEERILRAGFYSEWRSRFNGLIPPGDQTDGGGGGSSDPLQTKRTTYGSRLLSLLESAHRQGQLDEIDIYRLSGLKPKYQSQLFEAV